MPTYNLTLDGKSITVDTDMSEEEFNSYVATDEGYADISQQIAAAQPAQNPNATPVPDLAAKEEEAIRKYTESLGTGERFAIGAGKVVNDLVSGVEQLFGGEDVDQRIRSENKIYGILDEGVGAEDFGEFAGTIGTYLVGGSAGATVKGSAILGATIEGLKATDDGSLSSRAVNAAVGGAFGAGATKIGLAAGEALTARALAKADPRLGPMAMEILRDAPDPLTAKAVVEASGEGTSRLLGGLGIRRLGRFSVRGISEIHHRAQRAASAVVAAQQRANNTELSATSRQLYAQQAKQLGDLKASYFDKLRRMYVKLTPDAQRATIFQSASNTLDEVVNSVEKTTAKTLDETGTKLVRQPKPEGVPRNAPATYATQQVKGTNVSSTAGTLDTTTKAVSNKSTESLSMADVFQKSVVDLGDGRVGIEPATFIKLTGFMDNDLKQALPSTAQKQIDSIVRLMQRNPKNKVLSTQEIEAQLLQLAKLNNSKLQAMIASPMNKSQQKMANDILDGIIARVRLTSRGLAGAMSGTQDQISNATGVQPEDAYGNIMQMVSPR